MSGIRNNRLRALNVPEPVAVTVNDKGLPVLVRLATGNVQRGVEAVVEEWRINDEWWRHSISRRYVEVVLDGSKHVVLFEDLTTGEWWMQQP